LGEKGRKPRKADIGAHGRLKKNQKKKTRTEGKKGRGKKKLQKTSNTRQGVKISKGGAQQKKRPAEG